MAQTQAKNNRRAHLSKAIGWSAPKTPPKYPTLEEVEYSLKYLDSDFHAARILMWNRFLPSPANTQQRDIIDRICKGMEKIQ